MKYTFLLAISLISSNLFAGYDCNLSLAHVDDISKIIKVNTVSASDYELKSFTVENLHKNENLSLSLFIDGRVGTEMASLSIQKENHAVSDKTSLIGNQKEQIWFDSYRLEVECSLKS